MTSMGISSHDAFQLFFPIRFLQLEALMVTSPRPPSFSFVYSLGAGLVRNINQLCYLVVFLKAIKEKTT